jgi:heat shock protein HtpX
MAIRPSMRTSVGRDTGLMVRMGLTVGLLAILYIAFVSVLLAVGAPIIFVAVIAGGLLFVQYYFSDKIALASMGARDVTPEQAPELHGMIDRLCALADIPKPRVTIADTDLPNAFATGRSPKHAAVCVTTGLLARLDRDELEGVLGHELTHVINRDVAVMTIAAFFATVAGFLVRMGLWGGFGFGGGDSDSRNTALMFVAIFVVSIVVYALSYILINTLSRYREFAADRGGALLTGAPANLASALQKIQGTMARIPQRDLRASSGASAFFIVPASIRGSLTGLFSTHPSTEKRIERLLEMQRQIG